jgi:hypothetical protein
MNPIGSVAESDSEDPYWWSAVRETGKGEGVRESEQQRRLNSVVD